MQKQDNLEYCPHQGGLTRLCWVLQPDGGQEAESPFSLTDTIARCLKCPSFEEAIRRSTGRRESDRVMSLTLHRLLGQLVDYDTELSTINKYLHRRIEELAVLNLLSEALLKTQDLKKVLLITLTGVTSGEAFGFNRGMIFLVNEATQSLEGQLGLGHLENIEATGVWQHITKQKLTFEQLIEKILNKNNIEDNNLTGAIRQISIPLTLEDGCLPRAIRERRSFVVDNASQRILGHETLGYIMKDTPFAIVPLIYEGRALGIMLVDNSVNGQPIGNEDITTLETIANQTAGKIENAMLHNQLEVRYAELKHVHSLLKENQEYLVKSERLADLGRLASTVAHEIKTPLITIGGYAQRVLRKIDEGRVDRREVETIIEEITRLERISSEILDYSQKSQLMLRDNDLNQIISETIDLESSKLKYQNIELEIKFHQDRLNILSDKDRLKQVLFNLIHNAAEAMTNGGKIKITTGRKGEHAYFRIEDNGCGMDREIIKKLYTPFFTNKRQGTGLGLPVSKKIIDDHGGNIVVESEPERGSCFTINLPSRVGQ